ncbi:hypothetical protein HanRHA438_Chr00c48g0858461 [Helianthus annuus]|uniref:Uncharacterized protein n=1 Tax=Helianthus annuus TaxID=4232 RepID=A0A9K3E1J8_HELAN|nr:hypothetical protein HanXRQr2_Chr15g0702881 [Helianthus annuus]KAJ0451901.1 hypothetical protein HanHA300_Chr15g0572861 [Helianthus annuus]KAJ0456617.1 hypothetical protein HanIR_Chr15g0764501 [Helianthus annuus]KAJ0473786.1 hypothetical protein HanHA89_Chr15g0622341 [Helianthus annuus]KAJ0649362.1 hypothetical protein HanLR1_Chr15g0583431 [Helianthus annuus]
MIMFRMNIKFLWFISDFCMDYFRFAVRVNIRFMFVFRVFISAQRRSVRFGSDLVNGSVNSQTWSNLVKDRFDWFGSTEVNGSAWVKRLGQTQFRILLTRSNRVNSVNWSTQFGSVNASQTQLTNTNGTKNGKNL